MRSLQQPEVMNDVGNNATSQTLWKNRNGRQTMASKSSRVGLYRRLDLILPAAIISFVLNGWYLSLVEVGIRFLIQRNGSVWFGLLYILVTEIMFGILTALIIYVVSTRYHQGSGFAYHSDPPEPLLLTEPYECVNAQGDLRRCTKSEGPCYGKWKPPRTHHCSTCGVCRPGFDHHCPWLGACITSSNMPAFLLILIITPVLFLAAVFPIVPILPSRISHAFWVSRQTLWIREQWWDRWYSWVFIAGPPGRYMVGTLLGLKQMQGTECQVYECESPGAAIAKPGIRLILTIIFAVFLSIATGIMAFATIRDITLGQTTLDTFGQKAASGAERRGFSSFLCIPATSSLVERKVYEVLPGERLYDLGWRDNWRKFFLHVKRNSIFGIDERFTWPKINPSVLRRCRDAAPKP